MEITNDDKQIMISVLQTLHQNTVNELIQKIPMAKEKLNEELYQLMLNGNKFIYDTDKDIINKEQYRKITQLEGRWCLKSIIFYHMTRTKKISSQEYTQILSII